MRSVLPRTGPSDSAPADGPARAIPFPPVVIAGATVLVLAASVLRERRLLDDGGSTNSFIWLAVLGVLAAALLAFGTPYRLDPQRWADAAPWVRVGLPRYGLAAAALLPALLAAWLVHSGGSATVATVAWVAGMVLALAAALDQQAMAWLRAIPARLGDLHLQQAWPALVALGIVVVAAALRLPFIDTIPGYVHNDEASNGLMARSVADGQVPSLFGNGWANLPILGYAWDALFFKLFGDSLTSLRLSSAVPGLASIIVVALLGKELFTLRAGLLAAALLAVFHMHIHFSRVGHHYIQALFAVTLTLYLLVLALRYGSRLAAVGAGIALSVDIQVYYAARVAYVIVPLAVGYTLFIGERHLLRSRLEVIAWLILGWLVGVAPIGAVILGDWSAFTGRTRDVLVLGGTIDAQNHVYGYYLTHDPWIILRTQLWRVVQTFNLAGDTSLQYGSAHPMLDPISAALFPASVAYALFRGNRTGFGIALIALVGVVIVGGVLTVDPAFWPRLIILPALLALLIGALLDGVWQILDRLPRATIPALLAALALLVAVGNGNYQWYFQDFEPRVHASYIAAPMDIGTYVRSLGDHPTLYGVSDGSLYADHEAIQLLAPNARYCTILQGVDIWQCPITPTGDRVFFVVPGKVQLLNTLKRKYPGGRLFTLRTYDSGGKIYIYRVEG